MEKEQRAFELILTSNRNWLTRFGGVLTGIIIVLILVGLFTIKIPQYEQVLLQYQSDQSIALIAQSPTSALLSESSIHLTLENGTEFDLFAPSTALIKEGVYSLALPARQFAPGDYAFLKERFLSEGKIWIADQRLINCLLDSIL